MSSRKGNGVFAAVNTCTSTLCIKKVHSVACYNFDIQYRHHPSRVVGFD